MSGTVLGAEITRTTKQALTVSASGAMGEGRRWRVTEAGVAGVGRCGEGTKNGFLDEAVSE